MSRRETTKSITMGDSSDDCKVPGASSSEGPVDYSAYKTRPVTLRPVGFWVLENYWDEKRTSTITSESDTASLQHGPQRFFLAMEGLRTYEHLQDSADRFFRYRLLQESVRCPPDYENMANTGFYLTQHDVMIIRDCEPFEKKLNAMKSFPDDIAGEWQNLKGDLLLFPSPKGNKDHAHLKKTLRDIIVSLKFILQIKKTAESKKVSQRTTSCLLPKYDKRSNAFVDDSQRAILSLFKPIFLDMNFSINTNPTEARKIVLILEFLQKAVLIYMKLADLAMASSCPGSALALCRMQRYCCDHITYILDIDLDFSAYTHIVTNWMLANVFVMLYGRLQECYDLNEDSLEYESAKEELEPMYACIADMRSDLWEMKSSRKIIEYPWKFPREEEKLLEASKYYFGLISAPLHWKRTTYRKMFVQCKVFLLQLVKIIDKFATLSKTAHGVEMFQPRHTSRTVSRRHRNIHHHRDAVKVDYDRPLVEQELQDFLILVDEACSSAYRQHSSSTYCNDLKAILSVTIGIIWKIAAISEASNALDTSETNNNQEPLVLEDSPIQAREAYAYRKMRKHFKNSLGNVCDEDHVNGEALERSHCFRINLLLKNVREEVVLQIEQEQRGASYNAGVLGLVECLLSVIKVADFEKELPRPLDEESSKIMTADILLGLCSVYLIRHEKEQVKQDQNEDLKEKRLKTLLHNARYYYHAFAMYLAEYPYIAREVCRTHIDHAELVTDLYCRGGTPFAALTQDLLALRRLMPLLPVIWENCIFEYWPMAPKGYKKVKMTAIQIPFHKSFIEASFGQLSSRLLASVELIQLGEVRRTLEEDSIYQTSGELNNYAKSLVDELSNSIERIAVDEVEIVELQMHLEIAAEKIASIICTSKGEGDQNDSGYQKAQLANLLSKCMSKQFTEYILETLHEPVSEDRPFLKRTGGCRTDRRVVAFTSIFAVLCGMMGVHAVDFHWPYLKPGKTMESLSIQLVDDICEALYSHCTSPGESMCDKLNVDKITAFFDFCTRDNSLSAMQSEKLTASGAVSRIVVCFAKHLRKFSVDGNLDAVPLAKMVQETSRIFAYDQHHSDETWRAHSALIAKRISIGVLRIEFDIRSEVAEENPTMESNFEREEAAEGEVVFGKAAHNTKPNTEPEVGKLPTNVEQFHVEDETEFDRSGYMYADRMFEDVFYCTNSLHKAREFSIEVPLLRLINFLRADLDRHLKENGDEPSCKLFGIDLTDELLTKLNVVKKSLELSHGDGNGYCRLMLAFYALDKMFFGGTTSSILRGTLH